MGIAVCVTGQLDLVAGGAEEGSAFTDTLTQDVGDGRVGVAQRKHCRF